MENKYLIELSIRYGLSSTEISKLVNMVHQAGATKIDSRDFKRIAKYICDGKLLDAPEEELMEELRLKGLIRKG